MTTTALADGLSRADLGRRSEGVRFTPLMTCYLTDNTDPDDPHAGSDRRVHRRQAVPPPTPPTNSAAGVDQCREALSGARLMEGRGYRRLCIHGEVDRSSC